MKHKKQHFALVVVTLVGLLVACGPSGGSTPPGGGDQPGSTVDLTLNLHVANVGGAVEQAAVIISNSEGNLVEYKILHDPEARVHQLEFLGVPENGAVTVMSQSVLHRYWPENRDYIYVSFNTYDVADVQTYHGNIKVNPHFVSILTGLGINMVTAPLAGPCPPGVPYLYSHFEMPGGYPLMMGFECSGGSVDGNMHPTLQQDGSFSNILWATKDRIAVVPSKYFTPLTYLAIWDHDPNETYTITSPNNYRTDTRLASLTVAGLPEDALVSYKVTGIRKGAPFYGLQAYYSSSGATSTAILANAIQKLDSAIQWVNIRKQFPAASGYAFAIGETTRFALTNSLPLSDTWSYGSFISLPDPNSVTVQQASRIKLQINRAASDSQYGLFQVLTISGGSNSKYIRWSANTHLVQNASTVSYTFPELPDELSQFMPSLDYEYASATIKGFDYNPIPHELVTDGNDWSIYLKLHNYFE